MSEIIHVTEVEPLDGLWIRADFSDGAVKEVDLDPEVLYGRFEPASGVRIERRTIREPAPAAR